MKYAMEDLWNGRIEPAQCGVGDPEIEKLTLLMERHKNELDKGLEQQLMNVFEKYVDCADEYAYLISKTAFYEGFSLGVRLVTEAFFQA